MFGISFKKRALLSVLLIASLLVHPTASHSRECKSFREEFANRLKIYSLLEISSLDSKSFAIFERVRKNPNAKLTKGEVRYLRGRNLIGLYRQWEDTNSWVKRLNSAYSVWDRSSLWPKTNLIGKTADFLLSQIPLLNDITRRDARVAKILKKVTKNRSYQLTDRERSYFEKKKLIDDLERYRKDLKNGLGRGFATVSAIRMTGKVAVWSVVISSVALTRIHQHSSSKESDDPGNKHRMLPGDGRVELIFMSRLPEASIRIGGAVYRYSSPDVQRMSLHQFLELAGFTDNGGPKHTRVELKLSPEDIEKLRTYLDADVGKVYAVGLPYIKNVSHVMGTVSKAIDLKVPKMIDRSKLTTIAYLKLKKLLGDSKIGDITTAKSPDEMPVLSETLDTVSDAATAIFLMDKIGPVLVISDMVDKVTANDDSQAQPILPPSPDTSENK
jgi:hypothetical protein